jgi:hypothetical protein
MVTRTIGVVTAATLLMLAFQSLRGSGAGDASAGFLTGFQGAFQIAAAIPALLAIAFVLRAAAGVRRA